MTRNKRPLHALVLMSIAFTALSARADDAVTLTHVHGLSYSADGTKLMIPSHHGLAIYEPAGKGRWSKGEGPSHDYMGFSATRDALYSSGHPAQGSGLTNPFGLIKSADGGKTWRKLGLEGESDFHVLATSYESNAVYVVTWSTNSRMSTPGLYHTENDGLKWTHAAAKGIDGQIKSLAVHPTDPRIVVAGTDKGLFQSRDAGETFSQRVGSRQVIGIGFELDGRHILYSSYAGKATLTRIGLAPGTPSQEVAIPALKDDAVAYIAQNPTRPTELAIASYRRNVYLSSDSGSSWKAIAIDGASRE
jgi:photosystem II stability/assembly factor-like uncharacterized protein